MYRRPNYLLAAVASLMAQGQQFFAAKSDVTPRTAILPPRIANFLRATHRANRSRYGAPRRIKHAKAGSGANEIQNRIIDRAIAKRVRRGVRL